MERRLSGQPASPGLAGGTVQPLAAASKSPPIGDATPCDRAALQAALARVKSDLEALAARLPEAEAAILGFQIGLLDDPELMRGAELRIAAGMPADQAWTEGISEEIDLYEKASEPHFRARAADFSDLRDAVLQALRPGSKAPLALRPGYILVAEDLTPSLFLRMDWPKGSGIVLGNGSAASHVAMLARGRGIPMVVGMGKVWAELSGPIVVDGEAGSVIVAPAVETMARAMASPLASLSGDALRTPARSQDGRAIAVALNVSAFEDIDGLSPEICEGIGLVRTEFLLEQAVANEEEQLAAYARLIRWAAGRPVTIRTFDAGGDKPIAGYSLEGERNPFLGLRGLRLSLARPELFRIQLRAILRAAALGPVRLLLPMVTHPAEVVTVREHLAEVGAELLSEGKTHAMPPVGMMLEVPAAAMVPGLFAVDFYAIGTNDLTQFACAAARDEHEVSTLAEPLHPGVRAIIAHALHEARNLGRPVSLCGEAATDPAALETFLRMGLHSISVAPALLAQVKSAIGAIDLSAEASR